MNPLPAPGQPIEVDEACFDDVVVRGSFDKPVLVDFWATWCGPCRALTPVLEGLAQAFAGRFTLAKVDTDRAPNVASRYGVRGIPNCKLFVDGEVVDEFTGALPESGVRAFLERALPSPATRAIDEALTLLGSGEATAAWERLESVASLDPGSEALALARIEVLTALGRPDEASAIVEALRARPLRDERRFATLAARLEVARGAVTDVAGLAQRALAGDLAAKLDYANALAARGNHDEAFAQLIDVVRTDRAFRDDAARKTVLNLFEALGPDSDLVRKYRRELASALNR